MVGFGEAAEKLWKIKERVNGLRLPVPIPDKVKKLSQIFISIQLSEMIGSLRVKTG